MFYQQFAAATGQQQDVTNGNEFLSGGGAGVSSGGFGLLVCVIFDDFRQSTLMIFCEQFPAFKIQCKLCDNDVRLLFLVMPSTLSTAGVC